MDDLTAERYPPGKGRPKPPPEPGNLKLERRRLVADALRGAGRPRRPSGQQVGQSVAPDQGQPYGSAD